MRRVRHTRKQRAEILEQVGSGERSVGEIAQEQGISIKTIHNWMRAKKVNTDGFIEVPTTPTRATVVEFSFADGTALLARKKIGHPFAKRSATLWKSARMPLKPYLGRGIWAREGAYRGEYYRWRRCGMYCGCLN